MNNKELSFSSRGADLNCPLVCVNYLVSVRVLVDILKTFSPFKKFSNPFFLSLFTLTHLYKPFNLEGTLKYLIGFISAPGVNGLSLNILILTRVTFYPP